MNSLKRFASRAVKSAHTIAYLSSKRAVQLFLGGIVVIVISFAVRNSISSVELHNDEISWFFHTQFFKQVFITHDVTSSFWYSYESYDHPHLSKYIFGGYMYLRYPSVFEIRNGLEKTYGRWSFYFNPETPRIRSTVFAPYVYMMREVNMFFVGGSCFFIGVIIFLLSRSFVLSSVGMLIFAFNPFFMSVMVRGTSDSHVTFFMLASLVLYIRYGMKKRIVWLVLSSVCVGLAISSKLTGVLVLYAYVVMAMLEWGNVRQRFGETVRTVGILVVVSACTWIILNPTLYIQPIAGTIHYFDFRYIQLGKLQHAFPGISLDTIPARIHTVYCTLIDPACMGTFFRGVLFPNGLLNILAGIAGVLYLVFGMKDRTRSYSIVSFGVYTTSIFVVSTMILFINSDRYYTPMQISVFIVELIGVYGMITLVYSLIKQSFAQNQNPAR